MKASDKTFVVEGRQFRTESDYKRACHDREIIDKLRNILKKGDLGIARQIRNDVRSGKYHFLTILGNDFEDELDDLIKTKAAEPHKGKKSKALNKTADFKTKNNTSSLNADKEKNKLPSSAQTGKNPNLDAFIEEELKKREKRRKIIILLCSVTAIGCLAYVSLYSYYEQRTNNTYEMWSRIKEDNMPDKKTLSDESVVINYDTVSKEKPPVLEEYKKLLIKNQKLIGWVKIDDTKINYPVMQTDDNEYYLDHNLEQAYDKNGSIFMDKDCDVLKPSTNLILYGHHMKSGQMFGGLDKYQKESYAKEHPYILFDTIYERGKYQVMYVFRSRVYSEEDVNFKYYQFIDALSETEYDSYMQEMAAVSLYDTGISAQYGDRLLTLSTCDYKEENGRFVVVAKKIE